MASSGDATSMSSSGDEASMRLDGERGIAACIGRNGRIRAKAGCWIVLAEWVAIDGKRTPVCVKAAQVDGEKIKPDVWYKLKDGEFVEVGDDE
jgi:hypothetical protein